MNLLGNLNIAHLIVWYVVFVLSTTFHEFAHAYLAFRGGDLTAYQGGHLTLDPTPHIRRSPFGMVFVPIFSFLTMQWMIGWASVPFDPYWGKRHPRRQALMSLAGPAANLLLAIVAFVAIKALLAGGVFATPSSATFSKMVDLPRGTAENSPVAALAMALSVMLNLNVLLCLFNLLPIPPLDGAGVVEGAAPRATESFYDRLRSTPMLQVLGLVLAWHLFKYIAIPAFHTTVDLLYY